MWTMRHGDGLELLKSMPADSVDLVFGSPPYEDRRTYGIDFNLTGENWVDWMVEFFTAAQAACKGLVAFVLEGKTKDFQWSATPALLMADLHRRGFKLRKPPLYHRIGIPGSGGPDWLKNDYEFIVCTSKGKLPWSDNAVMGKPPKFKPGGNMTHRKPNGYRKGDMVNEDKIYIPPELANPGNVIHCKVGGNLMGGDEYSSQNEAPFPEALPEFFIRSFCPPGGTVCDPFSGSGTTGAVTVRWGRNFIGCDLRKSQVELATKRLQNETPRLFT